MNEKVEAKLRELVAMWRDGSTNLRNFDKMDDAIIWTQAAKSLEKVIKDLMASPVRRSADALHTCSYCRVGAERSCLNVECPIGYHNVWTLRGEDATGDGSDPISRLEGRNYDLGGVASWDEIGSWLQEMAGKAFIEGDDEKAHWFRNLAEEVDETARRKRVAYEREFKFKKED